MIAGPEVARVVELYHCSCETNTAHQDQAPTVQTTFTWQGCTIPD